MRCACSPGKQRHGGTNRAAADHQHRLALAHLRPAEGMVTYSQRLDHGCFVIVDTGRHALDHVGACSRVLGIGTLRF